MDLEPLAAAERRELADVLDSLDDAEWSAATLCTEWDVQQLVAHVVSYEELSPVGVASRFLRGGLVPDRVNDVGVRAYAGRPPAELVALLRRYAVPRGFTRAFGCGIALTDTVIHHQDVRRALGLPRTVPPDRLPPALSLATGPGPAGGRRRAAGLRLEATDVDWTRGQGPVVSGPGEALLMAVTGRPDALAELEGDGVALLAGRTRS